MTIARSLLPEFDQEMMATRAVLSAAAEEHGSFRPHPKSWTLGELGLHIANLVSWLRLTLSSAEFDVDPEGANRPSSPVYESMAETLRRFEQNRDEARRALESATDEDLRAPWTLKNRGRVVFTMPRIACVRSFVLNHLIHHRGQLTVYLRLCGLAVPPTYGLTADNPAP
ncbi:MAG: DinB family protein [Planctomycetota bacterium]